MNIAICVKKLLQKCWIPIIFLIFVLLDYSFRYFYHPAGALNWMSLSLLWSQRCGRRESARFA